MVHKGLISRQCWNRERKYWVKAGIYFWSFRGHQEKMFPFLPTHILNFLYFPSVSSPRSQVSSFFFSSDYFVSVLKASPLLLLLLYLAAVVMFQSFWQEDSGRKKRHFVFHPLVQDGADWQECSRKLQTVGEFVIVKNVV